MRVSTHFSRSTSGRTAPFHPRPPRVKRHKAWIHLARGRGCSRAYRQLSSWTNVLILRAALLVIPIDCEATTQPFGRSSLVQLGGIPRCGSFAMWVVASLLSGCATAPLVQGVGLSSYEGLTPSDGLVTKSRFQIRKERVMAAKTIKIAPTAFPPTVAPTLSNEQRALVANAVDRALCVSLSDRFDVVSLDAPADLTVRAGVTQATETNEVAAGLSVATSVGTNFIDFGTSVPIPVPRIPFGLGDLSIEAEAVDRSGRQQAAMLWGRGATVFFSSPRVSKASDAYDLADAFGDDFANLLVKGESPFNATGIDIPSWQKIHSTMGLAPKYAACENYGRYPGIAGFVGGQLGLPPEWTDQGANSTPTL